MSHPHPKTESSEGNNSEEEETETRRVEGVTSLVTPLGLSEG